MYTTPGVGNNCGRAFIDSWQLFDPFQIVLHPQLLEAVPCIFRHRRDAHVLHRHRREGLPLHMRNEWRMERPWAYVVNGYKQAKDVLTAGVFSIYIYKALTLKRLQRAGLRRRTSPRI